MSNIFVERKPDGSYKAIKDHNVIAIGNTQAETVQKAKDRRPDDTVLAERVRTTKSGAPDKWRRA